MTHRVGHKGQVVIPKELRERFGFSQGTGVSFTETDEGLLISPSTTELSFGMFKGSRMAEKLLEERRAERD